MTWALAQCVGCCDSDRDVLFHPTSKHPTQQGGSRHEPRARRCVGVDWWCERSRQPPAEFSAFPRPTRLGGLKPEFGRSARQRVWLGRVVLGRR